MMLSRTVALCVLWIVIVSIPASSQGLRYKLPSKLSLADYQERIIWVKLKEKHKDIFRTDPSGRTASMDGLLAVRPFVNDRTQSSNARSTPSQNRVDISRYYSITSNGSLSTADFIRKLYATGYFDVVEPVPAVRPFQTPNDPSLNQQPYLDVINAREAWDITLGHESMIIAIVDTGGDLDHPDLQDKLYVNTADPVDGIDNEGDGFIDNYRGWDFSGADLSLIGTPGFIGDNDPSVFKGNLFSHGTMVAGCAAASTNNGIGIASVGYRTKLLFTKHFADNQSETGTGYSSDLYAGILYAATHGAKIINCSWGSYNPSSIAQDIINYVTLDLGCLVVAASGNSNLETPLYPASYDHVLSVAASDANDVRSGFSNFGKTIDIMAPGEGIFTTSYNNGFITESGTSLAAPIVSGAAALVWTLHPEFTPLQVAEQLRVSADASVYGKNPTYLNKLGRGRLDVLQALTRHSPSIRASGQLLANDNNTVPEPGQHARLYFDFINYLEPSSSALKATITSSSPYINITSNSVSLGVMGQNYSFRNTSTPFEIQLLPSLPIDEKIEVVITFTDGNYEDSQLISVVIPSYIDINENNIVTSLTSGGKIGFGNTETQSNGSGFIYDDKKLLYEMGLIMGTSSSSISSNVRGTGGQFDQDFTATSYIAKHTPGQRSYSEVSGSFVNAADVDDATLGINFQSLVWKNDPYRDFVILEYQVKNVTNTALTGFYIGVFADWDIVTQGTGDRAGWDGATRLGYVYPAQAGTGAQAGIQVLTGNPQYYAIDNDQNLSGNPLGIYDGFTEAEKFGTISSGVARTQAGNVVTGNDVSHVVGSGPYNIAPGQTLTVAFALHASPTLAGLVRSAHYADSVYNYTLKAPAPVADPVMICYNNTAELHAKGAGKFKWYREFTGGTAVANGPTLSLAGLLKDTVVYVSNADHNYESLRIPVRVTVRENPNINVHGTMSFCEGGSVTLTTDVGDETIWSSGQTTPSIQVTSPGSYSVMVRNGNLTCGSDAVAITVYDLPSATFTISPEVPVSGEAVTFTPDDEEDVSWFWDFGDGITSEDQQPQHTYESLGNYTVTLQVTSLNDCVQTGSIHLGPVTGIEPAGPTGDVYPNPVNSGKVFLALPGGNGDVKLVLTDMQGNVIRHQIDYRRDERMIDLSDVSNGSYILTVTSSRHSFKRKIIVAR